MQVEGRQLTSRKGHRGLSGVSVWGGTDFQFQIMWSEEVEMRKVVFEQNPEGMVKEGAMQIAGEGHPSQKKQLPKGQEFCTTKPSLSSLVHSKFFRPQKSYFPFPPKHKCIHCLITAIIKFRGTFFYINRKNSINCHFSSLRAL